MNYRTLVVAAVAFSFVAIGTADAAGKHKRHKVRHGAAYASVPVSPYAMRTPGPRWAQPWECFTDEGYGRYRSCSAGRR